MAQFFEMKSFFTRFYLPDAPKTGATVPAFLQAQKRRLRQALLAGRNALPAEARSAHGRAVCRRVAKLPCFRAASAILLYYPVRGEIDLLPLVALAEGKGIPVGFPVCNPQTKMLTFRRATEKTTFVSGVYGIPTPPENAPLLPPDEKTVCLLPALGYDKNFYRLGYGGGYYDRFLADFPGIAVGTANEDAILETVYPEPHDRPVDLLVTENRVYTRKKN